MTIKRIGLVLGTLLAAVVSPVSEGFDGGPTGTGPCGPTPCPPSNGAVVCLWNPYTFSCDSTFSNPGPCDCEMNVCTGDFHLRPAFTGRYKWLERPRPIGPCNTIPCGECYEEDTRVCVYGWDCRNEDNLFFCDPPFYTCEYRQVSTSYATEFFATGTPCCFDVQ